jgi:plastocyanin
MKDRRLASVGLLLLVLLAAAGDSRAEEIRGRVQLLAKGGREPARGSDVRDVVVYFEPASAQSPRKTTPAAQPFELVTKEKAFEPRVLAIPRGSRVRFPNQDPILHNVFSVSGVNRFDLGLYRRGPGKEKRFDEAGVVRVFCNVHHDMVAYILVLDTPFFASPGTDGEFVLTGVPRGPGRLTVWHEQAEPWTTEVRLPQSGPVAARVEMTKPRIPAHLNKTGSSYFRRDRYGKDR